MRTLDLVLWFVGNEVLISPDSLLLIGEVSVLVSSLTEILGKKLTGGSFGLPTSGLWAQHASTAPSCWRYIVMRTLDLVLWFVGNEV